MKNKMNIIIEAINKTKGEDIAIFDFSQISPFVDQTLICHADNLRQVYAIATNIKDMLKQNGYEVHHFEGNKDSRWVLIDASDIIVHVFLEEERNTYKLERLYADLPRLEANYDL